MTDSVCLALAGSVAWVFFCRLYGPPGWRMNPRRENFPQRGVACPSMARGVAGPQPVIPDQESSGNDNRPNLTGGAYNDGATGTSFALRRSPLGLDQPARFHSNLRAVPVPDFAGGCITAVSRDGSEARDGNAHEAGTRGSGSPAAARIPLTGGGSGGAMIKREVGNAAHMHTYSLLTARHSSSAGASASPADSALIRRGFYVFPDSASRPSFRELLNVNRVLKSV